MVNVLPIEDWIGHTEDTTCICEPRVEYENGEILVIHNSADGREGQEE